MTYIENIYLCLALPSGGARADTRCFWPSA